MLRRARSTNLALCTMAPKDIMSGREQTGSWTSRTTSQNQAGLEVAAHTCWVGGPRVRCSCGQAGGAGMWGGSE